MITTTMNAPSIAENANVPGISSLCMCDDNGRQVLELLQVHLKKDLILIYQILVQQYNLQVVYQVILVQTYMVSIIIIFHKGPYDRGTLIHIFCSCFV